MSLEAFLRKTPTSKVMFERASKVMAGGVSGQAKFMHPYPLYIKSARGSRLIDLDGNEYVDFHMGAGPHILGHSPKVVVEAVQRQLTEGFEPQLAMEVEVELAEKIVKHVPCLESVRFCNSGTEASLLAIKIARAYTKKDKVAKFEGHYHGQHDYTMVSGPFAGGIREWSGPRDSPRKVFDCAGTPAQILDTVEVLPFNDIEATQSLIKKHANELACVIVEPVMGLGGCIPADPEFLKALRESTEEMGILLIFDEVMTGFRLALGGGQEYYGVTPDMAILGKIVGGGLPIGVYGGRKDIMERTVIPTKDLSADVGTRVFASGTFSGNPISMVGGLAMIRELEKSKVYPHINKLGEAIRKGHMDLSLRLGTNLKTVGVGSMFAFHFTDKQLRDRRDACRADRAKLVQFHQGLLGKSIYIHIAHVGFTCAAHTEQDVEALLNASEECIKEMQRP